MATVSTLLSDLGNQLNDPNEQVFTQSLKLTALNNSQNELVLRILAFSEQFDGIQDLLSEIIEKETKSVNTTGFDLANLTNRNILRNGLINTRLTIDGEFKFPVRYGIDKLGYQENSFLKGSDDYPVAYIEDNKYFLDIDVGSYPKNVTFWYIGEPYQLVASGAGGSGPSTTVSTPDLNVIMHDLLAKIAERDLRRGRGDPTDFAEAKQIEAQVNLEIQSLVRGEKVEPQSQTVGQFERG